MASYIGFKVSPVDVEFSRRGVRVPFAPSVGSKYATMPLLPAGHATSNRGPMMLRLLLDVGLVKITWELEWQSK